MNQLFATDDASLDLFRAPRGGAPWTDFGRPVEAPKAPVGNPDRVVIRPPVVPMDELLRRHGLR